MSFLLLHVISPGFDFEGSFGVIRKKFEQRIMIKFLMKEGFDEILTQLQTYVGEKTCALRTV
jgi:hypothetical protein